MDAARDSNVTLKKQVADTDQDKRELEKRLMSVREDLDTTTRAKDDAKRDAYRYKSSAEVVGRFATCYLISLDEL